MKLPCWIAVATIVVGGQGCRETVAPSSSTQIGENLIRLTVSSSASEVVRGAPVTLRATLVNEGTKAVSLHFGDSCQINPYIRNSVGETVLPSNGHWVCLTVLTELTLAPLQSVERDFVWTGSTTFSPEEPLRPFPPGKYSFTAEVPAGEGTLRATVEITLK
jgi:hypothetical protein